MGGNPEGELTQVVEITKLRVLSGLIKLMIGWGGGGGRWLQENKQELSEKWLKLNIYQNIYHDYCSKFYLPL